MKVSLRKFQMFESEYRYYRENYIGLCVECGAECDSVEPDATSYTCHNCGACQVYGVEELLIRGRIEFRG